MIIIEPSVSLVWITPNSENVIERSGRICYKSEDLITDDSSKTFIESILKLKHLSVLEHATASFHIICTRSTAQQITRHRLFSYSMESQRYCNYSKNKFQNEVVFVNGFESPDYIRSWVKACSQSENDYFLLLSEGHKAEEARSVLNNSCKTEIVMTGNFRSWFNFLDLRLSPKAQYEIRKISNCILKILNEYSPNIFKL